MKLTSTSALSERITALVSAAVAIALLGLAVSAQPGVDSASDPLERLESETRLQLRLGLGHDQTLLDARSRELDEVLQSFRASDETNANRQRLVEWLREAMIRSMPGSIRPLPQPPSFETEPVATAEHVAAPHGSTEFATEETEDQVVALQQQITEAPASPPLPTPEATRSSPVKPTAETDAHAEQVDILDAKRPEEFPMPADTGPTPTLADPPAETSTTTFGDEEEATLPAPGPRETAMRNKSARPSRPTLVRPVVATPTANRSASNETPAPSPQPARDRVEAPIAVNTARLSIEMASYHAKLGEVHDACRQKGLDFQGLQNAVDTLERLTTQYDFVRLYYDLLSRGEQQRLGQPNHWGIVLPEVRAALDRVARQTDGDFLRPLESDRQEALGDLRRQVNKLARQALP